MSQPSGRLQRFLKSAILATLLAGLRPLEAQMPELPGGKWWKRPRVVELLHLTPDQQTRMEEIFSKNRRAFIDLKADVERRQMDVEDLMAKKDSDSKQISTAIDSLDQARLRLGKARTMTIVEMKGILNAEQWQLVLDRGEEWRREREELKGRHRFDRMPGGFGRERGGHPRQQNQPSMTPPSDQKEAE